MTPEQRLQRITQILSTGVLRKIAGANRDVTDDPRNVPEVCQQKTGNKKVSK